MSTIDLGLLRGRAAIIRELRAFFIERGYLEVDTPALAPALIPEPTIRSFATRFENPFMPAQDLFLVPSPEVWMKRLLAQGSGSIFQISHCFRNAEQLGRIHNPEFTMLEWYTLGQTYLDSIDLTEALLASLAAVALQAAGAAKVPAAGSTAEVSLSRGEPAESPDAAAAAELLRRPIRRLSVAEAVRAATGIEIEHALSVRDLRNAARKAGVPVADDATWEEAFNALFLQLVEPALPADRPLVLYDYPAAIATLAKLIPGTPWSERWELYVAGIEIANCFTEETDPDRVRAYFREASARRPDAKADEDFPAIFAQGFPECSGVALGVDRLVMLLTGARTLRGVISFPFSDILASH